MSFTSTRRVIHSSIFYRFIHGYMFRLNLWAIIRSFINVQTLNDCRRTDDGSQLQSKHVIVNKVTKPAVVCERFDTYTCDCQHQRGSITLKLHASSLPTNCTIGCNATCIDCKSQPSSRSCQCWTHAQRARHVVNINGKIFIQIRRYCIMFLPITMHWNIGHNT